MVVPIADVSGFHGELEQTAEAGVPRGGDGSGGYNGDGDGPEDGDDGQVDRGGGAECDYPLPLRWNNSLPSSLSSSLSYGGRCPPRG